VLSLMCASVTGTFATFGWFFLLWVVYNKRADRLITERQLVTGFRKPFRLPFDQGVSYENM